MIMNSIKARSLELTLLSESSRHLHNKGQEKRKKENEVDAACGLQRDCHITSWSVFSQGG